MAARKKKVEALVSQADPRAPLDGAAFLAAAQRALKALSADLLARADASTSVTEGLKARWKSEQERRRTADVFDVWRRRFVVQVGAAWILGLVFARTLEDRGLVDRNRIAGPGAADSLRQFLDLAPYLTEREYLLTVFRELSNLPAGRDLFDARHNPVWKLAPSADGAKGLLELFRAPDSDAPAFRFGQADTRFLGDLYQDLDEDTRERFALLQTPRFVESFILDQTLEPAIKAFGLDAATIIDPTCGSGHFLLGAFDRLFEHRLRAAPGIDPREAAKKALAAVHGADLNPYAVAIARFRLTLAFLEKGGFTRLEDAPELPIHVVVGDSLLHGRGSSGQEGFAHRAETTARAWEGDLFALEDESEAKTVLRKAYAAVVGNPPYITVKDAVLREEYRKLYPDSAFKQYSLGAPFTERFFDLARDDGFVGMITANSFMKREFGKKLIEQFLPKVDLQLVVNTSGAYIPGHGTPTVLLFGQHRRPVKGEVAAVLAKRGEPSTPADPEQGFVWRSIADHFAERGFENEYVSVADVQRATLMKHPWSLGGGGAAELKELLEQRAQQTLGDVVAAIGRTTVAGEDDLWIADPGTWTRFGLGDNAIPLVIGECVRDWAIQDAPEILYPYDGIGGETLRPDCELVRVLWPWRTILGNRTVFGKRMASVGRPWWEHLEHYREKLKTPLSIAFAFVATHNHFVLDRGGKVFKQSAPIIKLPEGATEDDHLALLAYLNSSTACFWMKQVMMNKGGSGIGRGVQDEAWEARFEFDGTKLQSVPLPPDWRSLAPFGQRLIAMAQGLSSVPASHIEGESEDARNVRRREEYAARLREMVAEQEALDVRVYRLFGLLSDEANLRDVELGSRPFEVTLAREHAGTAWFQRNGYAAPRAGARSLDDLAVGSEVRLIEQPEFKRRWTVLDLDADEIARVRIEFSNVAEVALSRATTPVAARDVMGARGGVDVGLLDILRDSAVPFLAAYRLEESGLEKRSLWEKTWALQRREDAGEDVSEIPVPPKYDQKDYRDPICWRLRGKLDVPKERFISYPGCESDEDKSPVYGWAGWNHLQQAQALATLYQKRKTEEGWGKERLVPMLAGIAELVPWVKQWHNEPNADFGGLRLGDYFADFVGSECHALGATLDDLRAWRPATAAVSRAARTRNPKNTSTEKESTK